MKGKGKNKMAYTKEKILKKQREYQRKYRKNNKEKIKKSVFVYSNSEKGYFVGLWNVIKRRGKLNSFKSFDKFYNHWLKQKAMYGMRCPATKEKMTTIRGVNKPGEHKRIMTNISTDRIICLKKYSPKNLIFTTWAYNSAKNNMTPKMAKAFLRIVEERYGR
jgi:hypothetical protein